MISNNGGSWSGHEEDKNNVVSAFKFQRGQIVTIDLDTEKNTILFTNTSTEETYELNVKGTDWSVCILSYY